MNKQYLQQIYQIRKQLRKSIKTLNEIEKNLSQESKRQNIPKRKPKETRHKHTICYGCGTTGHIRPNCPYLHRHCYNCGEQGHIRQLCPEFTDEENCHINYGDDYMEYFGEYYDSG